MFSHTYIRDGALLINFWIPYTSENIIRMKYSFPVRTYYATIKINDSKKTKFRINARSITASGGAQSALQYINEHKENSNFIEQIANTFIF